MAFKDEDTPGESSAAPPLTVNFLVPLKSLGAPGNLKTDPAGAYSTRSQQAPRSLVHNPKLSLLNPVQIHCTFELGATSHSALVERLRSFTSNRRVVLPCFTSNPERGRGLFPPGPTCSRAGTPRERRRWTVTLRRMSRGKVVANVLSALCGLLFCSVCIQVERKPLLASVITRALDIRN